MANVCMDTVVFFAAENDQKKGFLRLRQAVAECYPAGTAAHDTRLCRIFEQNDIPEDGACLRSDVVDVSLEDDRIVLFCDSVWSPMYTAYLCIARHFGVGFELKAEEPGCGIYINTDVKGAYLTDRYLVCLSEPPPDGSLGRLFADPHGDTDFYFDSEDDLLRWFKERGGIVADSVQELRDTVDDEYVSIHEFENPY